MITDSKALPNVRSDGNRPAENQIAEVISILLPLGRPTSTNCPMPVTIPAPVNAMMCRQMPARVAASRMFAVGEGHRRENEGQHSGADAGADSNQDDRDPEPPRGWVSQCRRDGAARHVGGGRRNPIRGVPL
jgi:hypothetical protein